MFFSLLTKMYLDFGVEIVVILGITAEDEKDFVGIVGMGRLGKCERFGDGEQLDFNRKTGKLGSNATFFGAYVEHRRPPYQCIFVKLEILRDVALHQRNAKRLAARLCPRDGVQRRAADP